MDVKTMELMEKATLKLIHNAKGDEIINEENVFQPGIEESRIQIINPLISYLLLPESKMLNVDNLISFYNLCKQGKSCLILMEHYSNFDIPCLFYLIESSIPNGKELSRSIIPIAGMKLNEEHPIVRAFTKAFTRIVIYPSRSLSKITDEDELVRERKKSNAINLAALKVMSQKKTSGNMILVFPSGTRYRPDDPSTKQGVPEIDTYLKAFDYCIFISINGNILRINPDNGMHADIPVKDLVLFNVSPVFESKELRTKLRENLPEDENIKQAVANRIMEQLEEYHDKTEPLRQNLLHKNTFAVH